MMDGAKIAIIRVLAKYLKLFLNEKSQKINRTKGKLTNSIEDNFSSYFVAEHGGTQRLRTCSPEHQ